MLQAQLMTCFLDRPFDCLKLSKLPSSYIGFHKQHHLVFWCIGPMDFRRDKDPWPFSYPGLKLLAVFQGALLRTALAANGASQTSIKISGNRLMLKPCLLYPCIFQGSGWSWISVFGPLRLGRRVLLKCLSFHHFLSTMEPCGTTVSPGTLAESARTHTHTHH